MFLIAISIQLSMVPLIGEKFFMINSLFCLSIIFSLKETRIQSIIWGAFLGGLSDLLLFQHIGYNGIAFVVVSYSLGFFSHKMVISGILPIIFVSIFSFLVFVFISLLFMVLFQGVIDFFLLLYPFLFGLLFTPAISIIFDIIYRKIEQFFSIK